MGKIYQNGIGIKFVKLAGMLVFMVVFLLTGQMTAYAEESLASENGYFYVTILGPDGPSKARVDVHCTEANGALWNYPDYLDRSQQIQLHIDDGGIYNLCFKSGSSYIKDITVKTDIGSTVEQTDAVRENGKYVVSNNPDDKGVHYKSKTYSILKNVPFAFDLPGYYYVDETYIYNDVQTKDYSYRFNTRPYSWQNYSSTYNDKYRNTIEKRKVYTKKTKVDFQMQINLACTGTWITGKMKQDFPRGYHAEMLIAMENMALIVKYDGNGGDGKVKDTTVTYDATATINKSNFTRTGYRFTGWNTQKDGSGTAYSAGTKKKASALSSFASGTEYSEIKKTLTLYAQWEPYYYTIRFDGNGATSGNMADITNCAYDKSYALTKNAYKKTGSTFMGWNTKQDGTGEFYANKEKVKNLTATSNGTVTLYAQWDGGTKHILTVDPNGGTWRGSTAIQKFVKDEGWMDTIDDADPEPQVGMKFAGWDFSTTSRSVSTFDAVTKLFTMGSTDVKLTARYEYIGYNIAYDYTGGTGVAGGNYPVRVAYNTSFSVTPPIRTGYTFAGWTITGMNSTDINGNADRHYYDSSDSYSDVNVAYGVESCNVEARFVWFKNLRSTLSEHGAEATVTFTARWQKNGYTLTVNPTGGTWNGKASEQVMKLSYQDMKVIDAPTRLGYTFTGWTLSGSGSSLNGTTFTMGYENATLTANWRINSYTLTVNPNGGTWNGSTSNQKFTLNYGTTKEIGTPVRRGFTFTGWTLSGAGSSLNGTNFTMGYENATLTANWKQNEYTLTVNPNLGTWAGSTENQTFRLLFEAKKDIQDPARTGYTFTGWTLSGDGSSLNGTTFTMGWENATLTANWKRNEYTLTIAPNGGTWGGSTENQSFRLLFEAKKDIQDPARTGYTFTGWTLSGDGSSLNGTTFTMGWEDAMLTANWQPNHYVIRFDGNGATEGTMDDIDMIYDVPRNLPENKFIRETDEGKSKFMGWSMDSGKRKGDYEDKEEVKNLTANPDEVVILYAIWDDCPWIKATDLYYTLEQAQSGYITLDELMSHATAGDREDGDIKAGVDDEKHTTFDVWDYLPEDFTSFDSNGSVTETYRAIDSVGNVTKKTVTVHIVDTAANDPEPIRTTRFINEKYYRASYENGGLEADSIWLTNPDYQTTIEQAFANLKNDTPLHEFYFSHDTILQMRQFVQDNGFGNGKSPDALQRFCDTYLQPNRVGGSASWN